MQKYLHSNFLTQLCLQSSSTLNGASQSAANSFLPFFFAEWYTMGQLPSSLGITFWHDIKCVYWAFLHWTICVLSLLDLATLRMSFSSFRCFRCVRFSGLQSFVDFFIFPWRTKPCSALVPSSNPSSFREDVAQGMPLSDPLFVQSFLHWSMDDMTSQNQHGVCVEKFAS